MESKKEGISAEQIRSLNNLEAIRMRPHMYIGSSDEYGILHLINELVTNSIDEYVTGRCNYVFVGFDRETMRICVRDTGMGIPVSKLSEVIMNTHSGGKFDSSVSGATAGLNGVGLTACNATSKQFMIESNYVYEGRFSKRRIRTKNGGTIVEDVSEDHGDYPHGLVVEFIPDMNVFRDFKEKQLPEEFFQKLYGLLYAKACINQGFHIDVSISGDERKQFCFTDGIVNFLGREFHRKALIDPGRSISDKDVEETRSIEVAFNFSLESGNYFRAFVNGLETPSQSSVHVVGVVEGVFNSMLEHATSSGLNPKFRLPDVREVLFGIIISTQINPSFGSQTKEKFTSKSYQQYAQNISYGICGRWIESNPNKFQSIVRTLNDIVRKKNELEKRKAISIAANRVGDIALNHPEAFTDCNSNSGGELFITEGNSAAGNLIPGRNPNDQAVYALRGKITNVLQMNDLNKTQTLLDIVTVMRCGINAKKNIKYCPYDKFIITTDADVDGLHIRSLLLAFFFLYYPEFIIEGRVFVTEPPLYQVTLKNKSMVDFIDFAHFNRFRYTYFIDDYALVSKTANGKYVSLKPECIYFYLERLDRYYTVVDSLAKTFVIHPELLEFVVMEAKNIYDTDKEVYPPSAFKFKRKKDIAVFDRGLEHYEIAREVLFVNNMHDCMRNAIMDIGFSGVSLYNRQSKQIVETDTFFQMAELFSTYLERNTLRIDRNKGLGQMNAVDLKKHVLDKETRKLKKIVMEDETEEINRSKETIEIFFGKNTDEKKMILFGTKEI